MFMTFDVPCGIRLAGLYVAHLVEKLGRQIVVGAVDDAYIVVIHRVALCSGRSPAHAVVEHKDNLPDVIAVVSARIQRQTVG